MARPKIAITDDQLRQVELMAGWGMSQAQIAHILKVSPDTWTRRKRDSAAVAAAYERGKAVAESRVAERLFSRAAVDGDVSAIRYWENTRTGRTETSVQKRETSGPNGGPIQHAIVSIILPDNGRNDRPQS
jgi:hypothetical protein